MTQTIDWTAPGEAGLGDDISARLDAIGCLGMRLTFINDPAARDLALEAMSHAVDSLAPTKVSGAGELVVFNNFRQAERET
jgi:hypothetical protein